MWTDYVVKTDVNGIQIKAALFFFPSVAVVVQNASDFQCSLAYHINPPNRGRCHLNSEFGGLRRLHTCSLINMLLNRPPVWISFFQSPQLLRTKTIQSHGFVCTITDHRVLVIVTQQRCECVLHMIRVKAGVMFHCRISAALRLPVSHQLHLYSIHWHFNPTVSCF